MKVSYKPVYLPKGPKRYRYIIIHDTNCMCDSFDDFRIDTPASQNNKLRSRLYQKKRMYELPYHFVCEKILDDYNTVVARPTQYSCEDCYPTMDSLYKRYGLHVCIMGNFNICSENVRMYQQMAYRAITPLMKQYRIPRGNILMHGEVDQKYLDCPGFNFSKNHLKAYMQPFLIGQPS